MWLVPLTDVDPQDVARFGGKATALARLARAGLPVPPAVVIPADVFRRHLATLDRPDADAVLGAGLPAGLCEALTRAAPRLGARLVVRSSAADEDGSRRSFAGQYTTVVNVAAGPEVELAVRRCWASWYAPPVLAYRGDDASPPALAVVVQSLVPARAAGVLFTIDPMTGSWREMAVEAAAGMGEAVVSGRVVPDRYLLRRPLRPPGRVRGRLRGRVEEIEVDEGRQDRALVPDDAGGLRWEPTRHAGRVLDRATVERLGRLALEVEALHNHPVDVEWAQDAAGALHLLQARPITAAGSDPDRGEVLWTRRFGGERWTRPATPLGWTLVGPLLDWFIAYPDTSARYLGGAPPTRLHAGWPYFNVSVFRHLAFKLPGRPPPRFMLEFFPPDEERRWLRRFAAPPDLRVYASILGTTWNERRWERFAWQPWNNADAWERWVPVLEAGLDRLPRLPAIDAATAGRELLRDYVRIHICSLLFANLGWQLCERLLPPDLRADLLRCPSENATLRTNRALFAVAQGASLEDFLVAWGHRGADCAWEVSRPRWAEAPERVVRLLQPYREGVLADPAEVAHEQEEARARAVRRLAARSHGPRGRALVTLVEQTRRYLQLREDQRAWFDRLLWAIKQAVLRLADDAGVPRADVWFLEWDELLAVARGAVTLTALADKVARRKALQVVWESSPPPPVFLVGDAPLETEPAGRRLRGLGISPGRHTGTVRVLSSPDDAARLHKGDVLVATATDPAWTPLFLVAGAVVLELGSMLSHGAVVAREYKVPAVVNLPDVTRLLLEGSTVTVDGGRGLVWVEDGP